MFWLIVVLNSIVSMGIGWLVVRTAPFAKMPHAVFLTVLMFIYYLQLVIAHPPLQKSMTIVYMVAFPIAILVGAKLAYGQGPPDDETETSSHDAD
jgi:hypothetical protein